MAATKISIIILSYNTKEYLRKCLEALFQGFKVLRFQGEIIVVDNGSSDGSAELVESYKVRKFESLKVRLIENKKNFGFAKGNNVGLKEAKGDYLMILNSDTIVQFGAIKGLVDYLSNSNSQLLAVSPLLLLPEGKPQIDYYMRFPNLWQVFFYHNPILRPIIMRFPFLRSKIAQNPEADPFRVEQLPGAALIASKEIWQKVGFLDEDYGFLFEDVDWCWRAKKLGVKLSVVPEAKVTHFGGASWKKRLKENSNDFYYQFFASMLLFITKNYGDFKREIFKWAIILNFFLTLKPILAIKFFTRDGQQKNFVTSFK
jgi:GT2 family glycosyltransferase